MRKKYIALKDFQLITYIRVKGKEHICKFTGGFFNQAEVRNGSYTTSDKDIQDALEKDKRFGSLYALVSINGLPLSEYNASTEEIKNTEETQSKNNYKELVAEKKQLAIEELKSLFPDVEIKLPITNKELEEIANRLRCTFVNLTF